MRYVIYVIIGFVVMFAGFAVGAWGFRNYIIKLLDDIVVDNMKRLELENESMNGASRERILFYKGIYVTIVRIASTIGCSMSSIPEGSRFYNDILGELHDTRERD